MSNCGDLPTPNRPVQAVEHSTALDEVAPSLETIEPDGCSRDRDFLIGGTIAISFGSFMFYLALESSILHISSTVFELPTGITSGVALNCARAIAVLVFASLGSIAAYNVSNTLTKLILFQMVALNLVLHLILAMVNIDFAVPLTLWLSSWSGFSFGRLIKQQKDLRQRLIARDLGLELSATETSRLTLELIKHDEFERRILAADLHDQVLNDLKLLREKLAQASNGIEVDLSEEQELIGRSMQQVREVMDDLSPTILEHLGLSEAIESLIRSGAERAGYKVRFRSTVDNEDLSVFNNTEQTLIYRLVQECVTNICKHAEASAVRCTISLEGDEIVISIRDDGRGVGVVDPSRSRGLSFMHRRAEIIRAHITVTPGDNGVGTRVDINLKKPDARMGIRL
ncbi:MAG: hypothetical protein K2X93_09525 [Candidatus Obscuribacterales bacterium]|nr:hypothetical protein [Candidatus Obscuribacterales bacterium]